MLKLSWSKLTKTDSRTDEGQLLVVSLIAAILVTDYILQPTYYGKSAGSFGYLDIGLMWSTTLLTWYGYLSERPRLLLFSIWSRVSAWWWIAGSSISYNFSHHIHYVPVCLPIIMSALCIQCFRRISLRLRQTPGVPTPPKINSGVIFKGVNGVS